MKPGVNWPRIWVSRSRRSSSVTGASTSRAPSLPSINSFMNSRSAINPCWVVVIGDTERVWRTDGRPQRYLQSAPADGDDLHGLRDPFQAHLARLGNRKLAGLSRVPAR